MKQTLHIITLFLVSLQLNYAQTWEVRPNNNYDAYFAEAYDANPAIPRGVLEAVAYTNTHLRHVQPQNERPSCLGLPSQYGVMGLVGDGQGYLRNSLETVANLSGYSIDAIKSDPRTNILAYAKAYSALIESLVLRGKPLEEQYPILDALSELPNDGTLGNNYAFESQLYSIYKNIQSVEFRAAYNLPTYNLDLAKFFGEANYKMLSAAMVVISPDGVSGETGQRYSTGINRSAPPPCSDVSVGFSHAVLSAAADPSNYSSRNSAITHVTIHTIQGSYAGAISWFQNPAANVSAHYNIRASDGQITQSVCEFDKAWHVSNSNPYAIGIEHEGYVDDISWYTDAMYRASADLTKDIASRRGINLIRTYDKNGDLGLNPISDGCFKVKGHQHFPSQTHTDPGPNWDWNRYYDLLNPAPAPTSFTASSGTFYDSGGAAGNYVNDERSFFLVAPTGASEVTVNFSSFNLETNFDYLYVYDGDSYNDSLLIVLNGTTLPAAIVGKSGKLLFEFRSDCGTVASGWAANWTSNLTAPACDEPTGLTETNLSHNNVTLDWNDVAGAMGYQVKIRRSLASTWEYYTVTSSFADITGLALDGLYFWQVKALCGGGNSSAWVGREFVANTGAGNITTTLCSGKFTDTGGELANYKNAENWTFTISPANATSVSLTFSSFNLETNFDFMYIYDGPTTASPLIGTYHGTTLPPAITSTSGSLTIRFTSDNATVRSGWVADWTCTGGLPIYGNPILLDTTMVGSLDCNLSYHDFYDSGDLAGFYGNNENNVMTFCNPDTNLAVRLSFRPNPTADQQLSISSTTSNNDYLYIYNGANTDANLVGVYTGASSAAPQPGTFVSSGGCVTLKMESDNSFVGNGWIARLYCASRPTDQGTVFVGGTEGTKVFTDLGVAGNYGNNENYRLTYCPDASAAVGEVVWADFSANVTGIESNWDYLYIYDGTDMNSRLIAVYTGDAANTNHLGIIKATIANNSGCLTFQFFSDGATTAPGWQANIYTGAARLSYGSDNCATATPITQLGATYAGSTMIATGRPGSTDPSLNIALGSLPECSGVNSITRLENTVWYRFSTPDTICNATNINVRLNNISCQSEVPNGSGVQFVLYEANSCQNGAGWGTPLYCADKLVNGSTVDVAPYILPSRNYYIMIDGFTGQHCNFDLDMEAIGGSNPSGCSLPIDLLAFDAQAMSNYVYLDWTTAFESEVGGFFLQRAKPDGVTFEDIAFIQARGNNTATETNYNYSDFEYRKNAVNYYRLREVDMDGKNYYHTVRSADMRQADVENQVLVYPNPAKNQVTFTMQSEWTGPYELILYDITGKEIFRRSGEITKGLWQEQLDITVLAAGIYAYQLRSAYKSATGKFEKQ